ncbi:MAG: Vms1/Ankzf1 family peptidyl-tRNA hydrolase [Halobacteriaceae archaeon]
MFRTIHFRSSARGSNIFAVGRYEQGECTRIEGFNSNIDQKHSKGGFSQKRFERRREEQISDHLKEARELLDTFDQDTVILVGHHQLLSEFDVDTTATVDVTGDPKEALREAHNEFWTVQLRVI